MEFRRVLFRSCQGAVANLVSRAFDDSKLDEHFAIIPTKSVPQRSALSDVEAKVYEAIVLRYLTQFYPSYRQLKHALHVIFAKDEFRAHASKDIELGWRLVEPKSTKVEAQPDSDGVIEIINAVEALAKYQANHQILARGGSDRKSVVSGTSGSVGVNLGGRRKIKKKKTK